MKDTANTRMEWIDISRLTAIVFVVYLHFGAPRIIDEIVHIFHMAVFYLISGYCFSYESHKAFKPFIISRVKSLLVPYILFSVIIYSFYCMFYMLTSPAEIVPLELYLNRLLWNNTKAISNLWGSVQWFLTSLFFVQLIFWSLKKLFKGFFILGVLTISAFGFVLSKCLSVRLPLALDTSLVMIIFFAIGNILRKNGVLNYIKKNSTTAHQMFGMIACIGLVVTVYMLNDHVNVRLLQFGNPILFIIGALSGSCCIILFSWVVQKYFKISYIYIYI